ncbi:MAG: 50S ribosomal protein L1 [Dehalococcoidia bacterium]|nr:50S ribosomal protein L1 [Dehalococcoidia bacterium]
MARRGKKYIGAEKLVEREKKYSPREAIGVVKSAAYAGFDETVELHLNMNLDPRRADQQMRGVALLPHGQGKKVTILVFAQGGAVKVAEEAGADYVGGDDLVKKIEGGWVEFDVAIATPDMMSKVGKLGRVLGRRGLMPNPKSGTIVPAEKLPQVIEDARKGRVEYRLDRTAVVHVPLGKVSFDEDKILDNMTAIMMAIVKARPSGAKGQYIKSAVLCASMGPGLKLDVTSASALSA